MRHFTLAVRCSALIVGLVVVPAVVAGSADQYVAAPSGWRVNIHSSPVTLSQSAVAFAAYEEDVSPPDRKSLVVHHDGTSIVSTEIPGFVTFLEYSHDSAYLLVHYTALGTTVEGAGRRVCLVRTSAGNIQWTQATDRVFRFALQDNSILAVEYMGLMGEKIGQHLEILDLTGSLVRTVDAGRKLNGALLVNSTTIVTATGHSVERLSLGSGEPQTDWLRHLPELDSEIRALHGFSGSRVKVSQRWSGATLLDLQTGVLDYRFNVSEMDDADPTRDFDQYARFEVTPWDQSSIALIDNSSDGLEVQLGGGALRHIALPLDPPNGYVLRMNAIENGRVAFVSADGIAVRNIK